MWLLIKTQQRNCLNFAVLKGDVHPLQQDLGIEMLIFSLWECYFSFLWPFKNEGPVVLVICRIVTPLTSISWPLPATAMNPMMTCILRVCLCERAQITIHIVASRRYRNAITELNWNVNSKSYSVTCTNITHQEYNNMGDIEDMEG